MTRSVLIPRDIVSATLHTLQEAGRMDSEGLVLWLGKRVGSDTELVTEAYVPEYRSGRYHFDIPPASMQRLLGHLRATKTHLVAQVHSHPMEAFHSITDDTRAIVRHLGALSVVVPYFASATTEDTFLDDTVVFVLDARNVWIEMPKADVQQIIQIS